MNELIKDKEFADAIFHVEGKELKYHKCIIAHESEYFRTMFTTLLPCESNFYEIKDVSLEIFEKVIEYIYTKKILIGLEQYPEIANLAEMYIIPSLKTECIKYIKDTRISIENFLEILPYILNISYLKFSYMKFISINWNEIIKENKFYEILEKNKHLLCEIFSSVNLKTFSITAIDEDDIVKLKKYLNDKTLNTTPVIEHRILDALSSEDTFKDIKNIKELLTDCKISIPNFMKKYFE